MHRKRKLKKNTIVATIMSNIGLEIFLKDIKVKMMRAPVGDRYVVEAMRGGGYNFGGEQSGHLIFLDHARTGDGVLAALQLLAVMVESGKRIADLGKSLVTFPQVLINVKMKHRVPLENLHGFQRTKAEFEKKLGGKGRIVVRYSGTEPVLRIMAEGENRSEIDHIVKALADKARSEIH